MTNEEKIVEIEYIPSLDAIIVNEKVLITKAEWEYMTKAVKNITKWND